MQRKIKTKEIQRFFVKKINRDQYKHDFQSVKFKEWLLICVRILNLEKRADLFGTALISVCHVIEVPEDDGFEKVWIQTFMKIIKLVLLYCTGNSQF